VWHCTYVLRGNSVCDWTSSELLGVREWNEEIFVVLPVLGSNNRLCEWCVMVDTANAERARIVL
jgi:hypothetical protein